MKFLIIRFSSIGDIVLTTPVIRALRKKIPEAKIHFLTKKKYHAVIKENPHLNKIHLLDNDFSATIKDLKAENFDFIVDLHKNLRTTRVKKALKVKNASFDKINLAKWLMVNFKINKLPQKHIVDRYMNTLSDFQLVPDNEGLEYVITFRDEVNLLSLPARFPYGYIAFAIGAQHATKRLPTHKIKEICREIRLPVILLGGPEDEQTGNEIQKAIGADHVYNACGKYTLNQSASLVRQARAVITHDTGLMHIAAAYKKRIISVWGNTIPEFGMYPYQLGATTAIIQNENLACRPCSKIGYDKCPKKHFKCMEEIDTQQIITLANFWTLPEEHQKMILDYGKN